MPYWVTCCELSVVMIVNPSVLAADWKPFDLPSYVHRVPWVWGHSISICFKLNYKSHNHFLIEPTLHSHSWDKCFCSLWCHSFGPFSVHSCLTLTIVLPLHCCITRKKGRQSLLMCVVQCWNTCMAFNKEIKIGMILALGVRGPGFKSRPMHKF